MNDIKLSAHGILNNENPGKLGAHEAQSRPGS